MPKQPRQTPQQISQLNSTSNTGTSLAPVIAALKKRIAIQEQELIRSKQVLRVLTAANDPAFAPKEKPLGIQTA